MARSSTGGATWATFDSPGGLGNLFQASVAMSPTAGKVGIAFNDLAGGRLLYATNVDNGATWSTPAPIPSAQWGATLVFDAGDKGNLAFVYEMDASAVYFTKEVTAHRPGDRSVAGATAGRAGSGSLGPT